MNLSKAMTLAHKRLNNPKRNPKDNLVYEIEYTKDGKKHKLDADFLGAGSWTSAFLGKDNHVYLATKIPKRKRDDDRAKHWMAKFNEQYGKTKHIPEIEYLTTTSMEWGGRRKPHKVRLYRSKLYGGIPTTQRWLYDKVNRLGRRGGSKRLLDTADTHMQWLPISDSIEKKRCEKLNSTQKQAKWNSLMKSVQKLAKFLYDNKVRFGWDFKGDNYAYDSNDNFMLLDVFYTYEDE